jgi:hypothetical protein
LHVGKERQGWAGNYSGEGAISFGFSLSGG